MKGFFRLISTTEFKAFFVRFQPLEAEIIPLSEAGGRTLAQDLTADEDLPPWPRSAMDGFAVRAADVYSASESNPAYLDLVAEYAVDAVPDRALGSLETAGVVTGGRIPDGADAVVMVEYTDRLADGTVEMRKAAAPGENVLLRGEDVRLGEVALSAGTLLTPPRIGIAAALGAHRLAVGRRPVVAVLSTGDEITPLGETPKPGAIRDVNTPALSAMILRSGGIPKPFGVVPDQLDAIRNALSRALESADVLLVSGGSSVGTRDLTVAALESLPDSRILAHGVALSPGKPTILAEVGGKAVFGLPGQVTSAQVVFLVLVDPLLRRLSGDVTAATRDPSPVCFATLSRNTPSVSGREDYVRIRLEAGPAGFSATPIMGKSGLLRTMLAADGLMRIPAAAEGIRAGTLVAVYGV